MRSILDRFTGNISAVALLVSSFFWSWFDIVPLSPALFSAAGTTMSPTPLAISLATSALLLAAFAASRTLRRQVLSPRVFFICSLLCGSVGSLFIWIGAQGSLPALIIGSILIGTYQSIGVTLVGSVITCQGPTNALIHIATALPLNAIAILLVVSLRPVPSVVFAIVLPVLSAICFATYMVRGKNSLTIQSVLSKTEKQSPIHPTSHKILSRKVFDCDPYFLLMVLAITAAFGFANYQALFTESLQGAYFEYITIGLRAAVSLLVLGGYLFFSWRPYSILQAALLLMSLGLIATGSVSLLGISDTFLFNCLFLTGYACFDLLIWALIIMLSYKSGTSLLRTICVVQAIDQFGIFAGTLLGLSISENAVIVSCVVSGSALLVLAMGFSSGKNALKESLNTYEIDFAAAEQTPNDQDETLASSRRCEARISEMGSQFFLTSREIEVLSLLVAGRNGPYISEHLYVSENTVKSHIRHIYTKLNVHNRQELLDLVFPPAPQAVATPREQTIHLITNG